MEITDEIKWSLTNAGIGSIYHDKKLEEVSKLGKRLFEWIKEHGAEVKDGKPVVFRGLGAREELMLLAKVFHINGMGVSIWPLFKVPQMLRNPEKREDVADCQILFIMPAHNAPRDCPLSAYAMEEVEYLISQRFGSKLSTFLHNAYSGGQPLPASYWSSDFDQFLTDEALHVELIN